MNSRFTINEMIHHVATRHRGESLAVVRGRLAVCIYERLGVVAPDSALSHYAELISGEGSPPHCSTDVSNNELPTAGSEAGYRVPS